MPVYTFECKKCQKVFDIVKSIKDEIPTTHEECGGELIRDYSRIRIKADQGKSDPNSPMYWKKGKSTAEIASVIAGDKPPF